MLSEAPARTPQRMRKGKGGGTRAPKRCDTFADELDARLIRVARLSRIDLEREKGERRTLRAGESRTARILGYHGEEPTFVAYVERVSVDTIKRTRKAEGRDPDTGWPTAASA